MKYYKFQGQLFQMEERLFHHLLANEPGAEEITQAEYEAGMGIGQQGQTGQTDSDVGQPVEPSPTVKAKPQVRTKAAAIAILKEKGADVEALKGLKLSELKQLL